MNKLVSFPYENILVLGLAKSGTVAAKLLLENGKSVRVNDFLAQEDDPAVVELKKLGSEVVVGSHPVTVLEDIQIIVKNPGIPYNNFILQEAKNRNIPIITEIELANLLIDNKQMIGITGTNGKTTTTTLVKEMLQSSNKKVKIAGNIGIVASEEAKGLQLDELLLLELSSFQLMGTQSFRPHIAALLNLYDAHLDYHGSVAEYEQAKMNIFSNQTEEDFLVYNADDKRVCNAIQHAKANLIPFSTKKRLADGAWVDEENVYFRSEKIIAIKDIVLVGKHNLANVLAAICIAMLKNATKEGIQTVLTHFSGVKHRLQFVRTVQNRSFYNDSKATNILATEIALQSFQQPIIWLAGGLDRGNSFEQLIPYLKNVKAMVLFGQTAAKLKLLGEKANIPHIIETKDVAEAAKKAFHYSKEGDIILLSPACASWDQYKTFEERGDMFVNAVHILS